ncbi:MAG: universal stress protein [Rhizobacter sp.]|nr:universal stress protein [Rhizobacter sp.]
MYSKILVPLDGGTTSERALREAVSLAKLTRGRLALLHVVDDYPMMVEMSAAIDFDAVRRQLRTQGEEIVEKGRVMAAAEGVEADTSVTDITQGRVSDAILKAVDSTHSELVVMGTHGRRGFNHLVMGSDAEAVVRQCKVPVMVVRLPQDKQK